ncbi:MAG: hypothetical protein QM687_04680 [Ferruginibacter sp.]
MKKLNLIISLLIGSLFLLSCFSFSTKLSGIEKIAVVYQFPYLANKDSSAIAIDSSILYLNKTAVIYACPKHKLYYENDQLMSDSVIYYYFGYNTGSKTGYYFEQNFKPASLQKKNIDSFLNQRATIEKFVPFVNNSQFIKDSSLSKSSYVKIYTWPQNGVERIYAYFSSEEKWKKSSLQTLVDSSIEARLGELNFIISDSMIPGKVNDPIYKFIRFKYYLLPVNEKDVEAEDFFKFLSRERIIQ